ncbi:helicase-related protein [Arthrobacter sp. STN4]|uniref:helicase-related protein n=1 Tax=Arthrobacter sp. STN4 TaxID=2923276 RepID=UPI00211A7830|nr:helicase-related protein [Arthrobacter sp. STN4]MCQ9165485.1 helicase [Arthrobacter sp. STN4]
MRALQAADRVATEQEKEALARWGSWGASGVAEVFDETRAEFANDRAELRELLTEDEYRAANRTVINAHYTDPALAAEIWQTLQSLGYEGGNVLEPGSGSGTFIGLAPEGTTMTGVELDPVTAGISQALYPEATIRTESFADSQFGSGRFDAAVGNVPFGRNTLHDTTHNQGRHSMHNHFIIKSLDLTRPGGVVAVISSAFTLDAQNPAARREIYENADLLGAVRLPNGAHRRSAGTDALTDVLVFRRRLPGEEPGNAAWLTSHPVSTESGANARINDYFTQHPHRVLGIIEVGNGMYGNATVNVRTDDLPAVPTQLHGQLQEIATIAVAAGRGFGQDQRSPEVRVAASLPQAPASEQVGHIAALEDGTFTQISTARATEELNVPVSQQAELRALLGLRDGARAVLTLEASNVEDTDELTAARADLAAKYQDYAEKYGPINRFGERRTGRTDDNGQEVMARTQPRVMATLRKDPYGPLVPALEYFDEGTQKAVPAALLKERQVQPRKPVLGVDNPAEALAVTLEAAGEVDLGSIAALLGIEHGEAREALGDLVYDIPGEPGAMETRAEYLSGNIREKLDAAAAAAVDDPIYQRNVTDLQGVLPRPLGADEIEAKIGSVWISPDIHAQFLQELIRDPRAHVDRASGASWDVKASRHTFQARNDWGTERMPAGDIFKNLLEQRRVQVTDPDPDNPEGSRRIVNPTETTAAQEKAQMIKERFSEWVWEDPARTVVLTDEYNRRFNSLVLRDYTVEGERLTLPGLVKDWHPRPHQRAAVARMISEPSVGLFHEVGAGKTAEMAMGAMELRRLGMTNKPAVVVPNHMLDQFAREWLQLYPQARILAASSADLTGDKRREFVARVAANDWDAVIMTRTAFERIELSPAAEQAYMNRETDRMRQELAATSARAAERGEKSMTVKKMEARLQAREEKMKARLERPVDPGITFEQTGIDYLIVDELHDFKNLDTPSNISDAAIDGSKRASDLHAKIEYLRETHGDRVITGATATPIANSVTEMYVMQRYLRPDLLEKAGIHDFDTWAATFGEVVSDMEMSVAGGENFKMKERFAKFQNVPELLKMFHTFADVKTAEDLKLPVPKLAARDDGKRLPRMVTVEPSAELSDYIADIGERAEAVQQRLVDPHDDNMLKISSDGRKAALDMRLVDPTLEMLEAATKTSAAADLITEVYEKNKDRIFENPGTGEDHPTPGALQIVFCDLGTPSKDWNVYDQLKDDLVSRGVPGEKVRFMHDAKNDADKGRLFAACRNGDVAVLVGSTQKMGVGTNIQDRAVHLVDMDAPWRPADVSQRHGRIIRQGNQNPEVDISQVVTKGSFDTFMWQTLERKSRFIDQIMRGKLDVREIEDVGENTLSYAEVKAISSGNPLILEKSKADQELSRLERLSRAWNRNQSSLVHRKDGAESRGRKLVENLPKLQEAAARTTGEIGGDSFSMMVDAERLDKRTEAAEALGAWVRENTSFRPSPHSERDAGIAATIAGHNIRVVEGLGILGDINSSPVRFQIDQAPGVYVEVRRDAALNPNVGLITRLENQVVRLPQAVAIQEQKIEEARQDYRDAVTALREPFKHEEALKSARWEVERIGREMRGEEAPQPTFDAELEALRRSQRADFPAPAGQRLKTATMDTSVNKTYRSSDPRLREAMER